MLNLTNLLSPVTLNIEDILLDPNNPRFSELGEELNPVQEGRFADEKVQKSAKDKMKADRFEVSELKDTIKTIGFLPMDRIVVRKWKGRPNDEVKKYVVIEGNRRVTALKWLIELHDIGKETFTDEQLENFKNLECLILNDELAPEAATLILPGLRHVSGVKEWGAYQKAKAVHALRKSGMSPQDAAQSLGLSTRSANSAYRCFVALEQMKQDEEYGERADSSKYSFFEEVFKKPNLKTWLGWSEERERFCNEENLKELYGWIVPHDDGDGMQAKLPQATSIRDLSQIISDESALNILRSPEGTLNRALARYEADHPEDWYPKVIAATSAIKTLTPDMLRNMGGETITALMELQSRIEQALKDRELLKAN